MQHPTPYDEKGETFIFDVIESDLILLIRNGDIKKLKQILSNQTFEANALYSAACLAISIGHNIQFSILLPYIDISKDDSYILRMVIHEDQREIVNCILEDGRCDVKAVNYEAFFLCITHDYQCIFDTLIEKVVNIDNSNSNNIDNSILLRFIEDCVTLGRLYILNKVLKLPITYTIESFIIICDDIRANDLFEFTEVRLCFQRIMSDVRFRNMITSMGDCPEALKDMLI